MPSVRRQKITRYVGPDGRRCSSSTIGATKVVGESKKFYGFAPGMPPVPLHTSRTRSERMFEQMLEDESEPRHLRERKLPINEHIDDFIEHVRNRRGGKQTRAPGKNRLAMVRLYVTRAATALGWARVADLDGDRVEAFLCGLLGGGDLPIIPEGGPFTLPETCAILGRSAFTIRKLVQRHALPFEGRHPKRRYPRATLLALAGLRRPGTEGGRGLSATTVAEHASILRRFGRYLAKRCRLPENPLAEIRTGGRSGGRHDRRPLSPAETSLLLATTLASRSPFKGLTGRDRHALYSLALSSGFRRSELASLTPAAFRLDAAVPHVYLTADADKRGIAVEQPLPPSVVPALRAYLAGREPNAPVWPGNWAAESSWMLRGDLRDAGIAFVTEGVEGRRYADFHSLRHTFIASLDRAGLTLKTAMRLARHSTPVLTAKVYGRASLAELGEAVSALAPVE